MEQIKSLYDVRPGDLFVGDISGLPGAAVALGEVLIGDGFRVGTVSARHIGIVTEPAFAGDTYLDPEPPRMAQAMPGGAEVVDLTRAAHWTLKNMFIRLPEDYPGQGLDAAAIAVTMVRAGVAYSPLSYGAIALAWRGVKTPRLMHWIDRRRPDTAGITLPSGRVTTLDLPVEDICSVLFDQAWTIGGGKQVMPEGTPAQLVTPGGLARTWFRAPGTVCGGAGLLESE